MTGLYEVELVPRAESRMATVHLRWQDPDTAYVAEISEEFETGDLAVSFNQADAHLQGAVAGAEYAEVQRGSECAGGEPLAGVLEEAERVAELLPGDDDVAEFVDLLRRAAQIVARE